MAFEFSWKHPPPISIDPIVVIIYVATEVLRFIFDSIFGGPAGSGGVFRKAALDIIPEIQRVSAAYRSAWPELAEGQFQGYLVLTNQLLSAINEVWAIQDKNFRKYEGSNLLGATFFAAWTSTQMQAGPFVNWFLGQAYLMEGMGRNFSNAFDDVYRRLGNLEGGGDTQAALQELRRRMDSVEFRLTSGIERLSERIFAVQALATRAMQTIGDIIAGRQHINLPDIEFALDVLREQFDDLEFSLRSYASRAQINALLRMIENQGSNIRKAVQDILDLQRQLRSYDIPGMQAAIKRLQDNVKEIPRIQKEIDDLERELDRVKNVIIPDLRHDFDLDIDRIDQRFERFKGQDFDPLKRLVQQCCDRSNGFLDQWPRTRDDILQEACDRAQSCVDIPEQKPEPCFQLVNRLIECCTNGSPVEKNALKQLYECLSHTDEPAPEEPPPFRPIGGVRVPLEQLPTRKV